jgi:hypothetical protein
VAILRTSSESPNRIKNLTRGWLVPSAGQDRHDLGLTVDAIDPEHTGQHVDLDFNAVDHAAVIGDGDLVFVLGVVARLGLAQVDFGKAPAQIDLDRLGRVPSSA